MVTGEHELRALQRVFREAKFCPEAGDDEITNSPIVAAMFARLMDALIATESAREGSRAKERWETWLEMDNPLREEWSAVRRRIEKNIQWPRLGAEEKQAHIKLLFQPFRISDERVKELIEQIDGEYTSSC